MELQHMRLGTSTVVRALAASFVAGALYAASSAAAAGTSIAACPARSHAEPARLNIDTSIEGYGFMPPCTATLDFYIPRTTALRALDGMIRMVDATGSVVSEDAELIELQRRDNGMYAAKLRIGPVAGNACGSLTARVDIAQCLGEDRSAVECPAIRV